MYRPLVDVSRGRGLHPGRGDCLGGVCILGGGLPRGGLPVGGGLHPSLPGGGGWADPLL